MTLKEMSEIFSVFLVAYPSAEMFKGGSQKLETTIRLWTAAVPEINFNVGQEAAIELCRTCKFPPTIAEFLEVAERITSERKMWAFMDWQDVRRWLSTGGPELVGKKLDGDSRSKRAIVALGGLKALSAGRIRYDDFEQAYIGSGKAALPSSGRKQIGGT